MTKDIVKSTSRKRPDHRARGAEMITHRTYFGPFEDGNVPAFLELFLMSVSHRMVNEPTACQGWGGFWISFPNEIDEIAFLALAVKAGLLTEVSK